MQLDLTTQSTNICITGMSIVICNILEHLWHLTTAITYPPPSSYIFLKASGWGGGLQRLSDILSCSRCCNLVKVREAICMEMRQRDLTLQNHTRIHFFRFLHKTAEIFQHWHPAANIQYIIFTLRAGHSSSTVFTLQGRENKHRASDNQKTDKCIYSYWNPPLQSLFFQSSDRFTTAEKKGGEETNREIKMRITCTSG